MKNQSITFIKEVIIVESSLYVRAEWSSTYSSPELDKLVQQVMMEWLGQCCYWTGKKSLLQAASLKRKEKIKD